MKPLPIAALLAVFAAPALAGDHAYGPFPADYVEECASCHVAYPPQLLTAPGWQRVMAQLDKHYGVDASLDAKRHAAIADFLRRAASRGDKLAPTEMTARMTKTAWFAREHGPTPPAKTSFADCAACHTAADKGDYGERGIRLPTGWRRVKERRD
ncbi:MAG: diheme cytochrome c [Candidatus Nitricoxidivorans perseverans]|uniref:Diheme cytochrome c n=1 Tax=Candidatus Nitricoxidivorans perseverans TaxID=2975601 RepID=A0AA49FMR2_9PROT|nr:MAG: diheme cytochrome c [Candidatus Nitricoxidivorans perseverans]